MTGTIASTDAERILSVFDFDGTLTRRDSFLAFLQFAFGTRRCATQMMRLAPLTLRYLGGRLPRDELKAALIATFLKDVPVAWLEDKACAFHKACWRRLMRPAGMRAVAAELAGGAEVTLCSASPRLILQPFAEALGIKLIGTELEAVDGKLTGRIRGGNCRGQTKALRLERAYGALAQYTVRAWGDTRGDHELLSAAQEPHWRSFHPRWRRPCSNPYPPAGAEMQAGSATGSIRTNAVDSQHNNPEGA